MKSFVTRSISALFAIGLLYLLYHFMGNDGLKLLNTFVVALATYELLRILFKPDDSKLNRTVFYVFSLCIFLISTQYPLQGAVIFSLFSIGFCLISLITQKKFEDLHDLTAFQSKTIMGFMYIGLLPSFAVGLLDLPNGLAWFIALLAVVFCGDVGAYITGMFLGRRKLMPLISPKKTIEGAFGGLAFSVLAGLVVGQWLPHVAPGQMILLSLVGAVAGQFGDLFESQLKRVADVKDSGTIMPGHGGILDRIDGVLFASPVIYFGARLLEGIF